MKIEMENKNLVVIKLKLSEAVELRDSLADLIKQNNFQAHHHICDYNLEKGTIDSELIVLLER